MAKNFVRPLIVAIALSLFVVASAPEAQAAPVFTSFACSQGIQDVVWNGGGLFIDCIGQPNRFVAYTFSPCAGFGAQSLDTIKMLEALATSAMISGKLLTITYATPASCDPTIGVFNTLMLSR